MKNKILKTLFFLVLIFFSCEQKKEVLEIYLTKNRIESYEGVPLRVAIKDSVVINQVLESYREEIRIDTIKNKPIYMGRFQVNQQDLEEKPFIIDSEILGFDFENSEIHFKKSVAEKIYNSIPNWRKKSHFGRQFVLCHNGVIILKGYFLNSWSSYHSSTYQIYYHPLPEKKIADTMKFVRFLMSDSLKFDKNILKKNNEFYDAFRNR